MRNYGKSHFPTSTGYLLFIPPNTFVNLGLLNTLVTVLTLRPPATNGVRYVFKKLPCPLQHQHPYGETRSYPHPIFGQQIRPLGAAMISPIQSKRSTCSHRHVGRALSRSVWLSVSGQLDSPDVAGVRDSTFICVYACEPGTSLVSLCVFYIYIYISVYPPSIVYISTAVIVPTLGSIILTSISPMPEQKKTQTGKKKKHNQPSICAPSG